jgi:hypothetical protein
LYRDADYHVRISFFMTQQIEIFDRQYRALHDQSVELLRDLDDSDLFRRPREFPQSMAMFSCGEYLLRAAAAVEQMCLGITTRLWDDPFEWTLPEKLSTTVLVGEYLDEVELSRLKAFSFFKSDDDLGSQLPAPEKLTPIFSLLLTTLTRAAHFQGRAFAIFQVLSDHKLPRL